MPRRTVDDDGGVPLRTTDLLVLAILVDGPQHGYAIAQEMSTRSRGQVTVRPGDLYRVLYRMDSGGLIEPVPASARRDASERDGRRSTYRITPKGRRVARIQATMLRDICAAVLSNRSIIPGAAS